MKKAKNENDGEVHREYLDKLIEEATADAYNESKEAGGFFTLIEEHLALHSRPGAWAGSDRG